jgi:hypothetical protein
LPTSRTNQSDKIEDAPDYALIIQRINQILPEFQSPRVKVSVAKLGIIRGVKKLAFGLSGVLISHQHHKNITSIGSNLI